MKCTPVKIGDTVAIVCGGRRRPKLCKCDSGLAASKLCDWKIDSYHTCDAPLCDTCTRSPAPNKDLCPRHWKIWEEHPENPANKEQAQ